VNYLALGDSISIDDYTEVKGGGAASQFAKLIGADTFQNLTVDGRTTEGVLASFGEVTGKPDIVTLTVGGNDLLMGIVHVRTGITMMEQVVNSTLKNLNQICGHIAVYNCPTIINTIYDPTDGSDIVAAAIGLPPSMRGGFNALNAGIKEAANRYGFLLCDLEVLFHKHGVVSFNSWIVSQIEPNLKGATAIAKAWHSLVPAATGKQR